MLVHSIYFQPFLRFYRLYRVVVERGRRNQEFQPFLRFYPPSQTPCPLSCTPQQFVSTLLEILRTYVVWQRPTLELLRVSTLLEILPTLSIIDTPKRLKTFQPFLRFYTDALYCTALSIRMMAVSTLLEILPKYEEGEYIVLDGIPCSFNPS